MACAQSRNEMSDAEACELLRRAYLTNEEVAQTVGGGLPRGRILVIAACIAQRSATARFLYNAHTAAATRLGELTSDIAYSAYAAFTRNNPNSEARARFQWLEDEYRAAWAQTKRRSV